MGIALTGDQRRPYNEFVKRWGSDVAAGVPTRKTLCRASFRAGETPATTSGF